MVMSLEEFERTIESATGRTISEIQEQPTGELHEEMRRRNGGELPVSKNRYITEGHECIEINELRSSEECDKDAVNVIRTPWHEYVMQGYDLLFGR
jgi:hypothetical protein